jgi:hypothetical protein
MAVSARAAVADVGVVVSAGAVIGVVVELAVLAGPVTVTLACMSEWNAQK